MAKSKSTARGFKPKGTASGDLPPTPAERNRAIRHLQKAGGAHLPKPFNGLVQDSPAQTIESCRRVVDWLAHIEQPFSDDELDAAEADILHMVVDALDHAEKVVRSIGSQPDAITSSQEALHG